MSFEELLAHMMRCRRIHLWNRIRQEYNLSCPEADMLVHRLISQ
jgi:hypothetical protein